ALRSYLRTSTVLSSLSHVVHRTSLPSTSLFLSLFFFQEYGHHRDLHSFPTRRSSDLQDRHCGPCHGAAARAGVDAESCAGETPRSEEHTSELQSLTNLVCRLLLEKKKTDNRQSTAVITLPSRPTKRRRPPRSPLPWSR